MLDMISMPIKILQRRLLHSFHALYKESKVTVDQWQINYLKVGNGPHSVLCLPGTLGTIWTDFQHQIDGFDRSKYTLIVWDPPGYGKSRPPLKTFKRDLYESDARHAHQFMQALQIPKYSILGWSGGGITGVIHAALYPEVMHKLVVWGTPTFILQHNAETYKKMRNLEGWSNHMKQNFLKVYGVELLTSYWNAWVDLMVELHDTKGNLCFEELKYVKCPTLVLSGEKDPMCDPIHAQLITRIIADSKLFVYPDGKHNIHMNYASDFNSNVQKFLQQQNP